MPVTQPFRRTWRQFATGRPGASINIVTHPSFAQAPDHYIRAYLLIQKDLIELFDYIEPADTNGPTFSYRIHELFLRTCVEIEANWKAILTENHCPMPGRPNITTYYKVEQSHKLSSFRVKIPYWRGTNNIRQPFASWATTHTLTWYEDYHSCKHDRNANFPNASFQNLLDAVCGLVAIIASQFYTNDFSPGADYLITEGPGDGSESAIGGYFRVYFPTWPEDDRYDFDYAAAMDQPDPFIDFQYT